MVHRPPMHAYGPVPSRRFGRSVGISPIPEKTCSYSCIYCQLGHTTNMTIERKHYFPLDDILADIERVVKANSHGIDFLTLVGDGEPTLSADLGDIIHACKTRFPYKVGVITNGSLLWMEDVRKELGEADVVNISMSTSDPEVFKGMHRPHRELSFEKIMEGIRQFAATFSGQIWAEIMLIDNVNTDYDDLRDIRKFLDNVQPSRIYVMTPIRPPAERWVHIPPPEKILMALSVCGGENITQLERGSFGLDEFEYAEKAISEICRRHPLRLSQARTIEAYFAQRTLDRLVAEGKFKIVDYQHHKYVLPSEFMFGASPSPRG